MEKLKKIANGEEVEDDASVGYQESMMTTGQENDKDEEGKVIGPGKVKKKKKGKKKKKKSSEEIKEESENEEDAKEKRW